MDVYQISPKLCWLVSCLMQVFQALVKLYRVHQLVLLYSGKRLNNYESLHCKYTIAQYILISSLIILPFRYRILKGFWWNVELCVDNVTHIYVLF